MPLESADFYHVLFENARDGIFITDLSGIFLEVNKSGHEILGYLPGELIGKHLSVTVRQSDKARMGESLERLKQVAATAEWTLLRKDGSEIECEITAQQISGSRLLGILRDISVRKAAERELKIVGGWLWSLIHALPGFAVFIDPNYRVLISNARMAESLGVPHSEIIGKSILDLIKNPEVANSRRKQMKRVFETGVATQFIDSNHGRIFENHICPVLDPDKNVTTIAIFATDITDRKRLEEHLLQSQKEESIGRLAGGVAHDFNNLLTTIIGFAEIAKMHVKSEPKAIHGLTRVLDAANRGAALTKQLLAFARKQVLHPEIASLNQVLSRAEFLLHRLIGEDIQLILRPASDLGKVLVDVGSIDQVIMNLALNARDAMPSGGTLMFETQNVRLHENDPERFPEIAPGPFVMMRVTDNGTGMTPDVLSRLFEPFFTTKPLGKGTGLGLAMCHGIIKQAGGFILVSSTPGIGTCFKVFLPEAVGASAIPEPAPQALHQGGSETILLVEDDLPLRELANEVLTGMGYRVLLASHGEEAASTAAKEKDQIHLLMTDVVMPQMSGPELMSRILRTHPKIKVLYSSGYAESITNDHGVPREGANFIAKPYSPSALAVRIRGVLDSNT